MILQIKHFPKSEFENRWKNAREQMQKNGLDALLVTDEQNYVYLSGHSDRYNADRKSLDLTSLSCPLTMNQFSSSEFIRATKRGKIHGSKI